MTTSVHEPKQHKGNKALKRDWIFHPFEIAVCGYKNSGKTTLLEGVSRCIGSDLQIGYLKHDAHRFEMDHQGKDTFRLTEAGSAAVHISNGNKKGSIVPIPPDPPLPDDISDIPANTRTPALAPYDLIGSDVLLVEGYKASGLPRIMLLDEAGDIVGDPAWDIDAPFALAGPWPAAVYAAQGRGTETPLALRKARQRFPTLRYFHRNDIQGISDFILGFWHTIQSAIPLRGLVLSGGRSSRMGRDKALLEYGGEAALDRAETLLSGFCDSVHVSCRADQEELRRRPQRNLIFDRFIDMGPLGGILSAMLSDPSAAWLVIACDLPLLDQATISQLIDNRAAYRFATCYLDDSGLPEPLCTIFEPKSMPRLMQFLGLGHDCPRKMLCGSRVRALRAPAAGRLANANELADYERYSHDLDPRS